MFRLRLSLPRIIALISRVRFCPARGPKAPALGRVADPISRLAEGRGSEADDARGGPAGRARGKNQGDGRCRPGGSPGAPMVRRRETTVGGVGAGLPAQKERRPREGPRPWYGSGRLAFPFGAHWLTAGPQKNPPKPCVYISECRRPATSLWTRSFISSSLAPAIRASLILAISRDDQATALAPIFTGGGSNSSLTLSHTVDLARPVAEVTSQMRISFVVDGSLISSSLARQHGILGLGMWSKLTTAWDKHYSILLASQDVSSHFFWQSANASENAQPTPE